MTAKSNATPRLHHRSNNNESNYSTRLLFSPESDWSNYARDRITIGINATKKRQDGKARTHARVLRDAGRTLQKVPSPSATMVVGILNGTRCFGCAFTSPMIAGPAKERTSLQIVYICVPPVLYLSRLTLSYACVRVYVCVGMQGVITCIRVCVLLHGYCAMINGRGRG